MNTMHVVRMTITATAADEQELASVVESINALVLAANDERLDNQWSIEELTLGGADD